MPNDVRSPGWGRGKAYISVKRLRIAIHRKTNLTSSLNVGNSEVQLCQQELRPLFTSVNAVRNTYPHRQKMAKVSPSIGLLHKSKSKKKGQHGRAFLPSSKALSDPQFRLILGKEETGVCNKCYPPNWAHGHQMAA